MKIDSYIRQIVHEGWSDKEKLWDHDDMYGTRRDREDHEAKVARLGLALGISTTPDEFLTAIEKIETLEDQRVSR